MGDLHLPGVSPFTNETPLAFPLLYSYIQPLTSQTHLYTLNVHSTPPLMYQMPMQDLILHLSGHTHTKIFYISLKLGLWTLNVWPQGMTALDYI